MLSRKLFFDNVHAIIPHLSQSQVDGFNHILDEWDKRQLTDIRWLAYMLATCFWETGQTIQPVREGGGEAYLRTKKYYPYVGMGLVQVTGAMNYAKFGIKQPEELLTWPVALRALYDGMIKGMFTGKKLVDYFSTTVDSPTSARRIINGTDKAEEIARLHYAFLGVLQKATVTPAIVHTTAGPATVLVPNPTASIVVKPTLTIAKTGTGYWTRLILALFGRSP